MSCCLLSTKNKLSQQSRLDANMSWIPTPNVVEKKVHPNYNRNTLEYEHMMVKIDGDSAFDTVHLDGGSHALDAMIVMG